MPHIGVIFPPDQPPERLREVAQGAEALPDAAAQVRAARRESGRDGEAEVLVFQTVAVGTSAEIVAEQIRQRAAEGAHRVAVTVVASEGGPPEPGPALLDMLPVLGRARELVHQA